MDRIPRCILFDLGGTIIESYIDNQRQSLSEYLGTVTGVGLHDFRDKALDLLLTSNTSEEKLLEQICMAVGYPCVSDVISKVHSAEFRSVLLPGAHELIHALRERCRLGILSNCSVFNKRSLASLGIEEAFENILLSFELGSRKPCQEIFRQAELKFGVQPADVLFIGDSLEHDILPALKRGWNAVWITTQGKRDDLQVLRYPCLHDFWTACQRWWF